MELFYLCLYAIDFDLCLANMHKLLALPVLTSLHLLAVYDRLRMSLNEG